MSSIEHLITVAELDKYPDDDGNRYELIEGELFVSTAPGIPHQLVLKNLIVILDQYLQQNPIGKLVPGAGTVFSDFDAVLPDLVFARHDRWDKIVANNRFIAAPDLVIEILSPGNENRRRDVIAKKRLYEKFGVLEYWIVDPEKKSVVVLTLTEERLREKTTCKTNDPILSDALAQLQISVSALFV